MGFTIFDLFQVMHVLGFDPHAFAHFRDERKKRRSQVHTAPCAVKCCIFCKFELLLQLLDSKLKWQVSWL